MKPVMGIGCVDSRILRLGLSANALLVFTGLLAHMDAQGICWPSIHRLSEMLNIRRNTVAKGIKELELARVLDVSRGNRTRSLYQLRPLLSWNLAQLRPQITKKSGSNEAPAKRESGSNEAPEVIHTQKDVRTAARFNDGKVMEDDFWHWFTGLPFNGRCIGDVRLIPVDVRRSSNAKQLLHLAWNMNPWFKKACAAIAEWYSWPWTGNPREKRRTSIRGLIWNFQEQADLAHIAIEERGKFTVVSASGSDSQ